MWHDLNLIFNVGIDINYRLNHFLLTQMGLFLICKRKTTSFLDIFEKININSVVEQEILNHVKMVDLVARKARF